MEYRKLPHGSDNERFSVFALAGDDIAANHYTKLSINAQACLHCGHCESRCPFSVKQESRMEQIAKYFASRK